MIQTFFLLNRAGLCYIDRTFGEIDVDRTLISGFLAALTQLGSEILKKGDEVSAIDYKNYSIVHVAKDEVLAVAVIDKTDDVLAVRKVISILLSLFVETYNPGQLHMFDDSFFQGFIPTIDEVLQKGAVSGTFEEFSSPPIETTFEALVEAIGDYDVLSRLMRLLLVREPIILICQDGKTVLWNLWMFIPHRRCLMTDTNLSQFQVLRLTQDISQRIEDELRDPDIRKSILLVPEANENTIEALKTIPMGWAASRTHFPDELKKKVSNIILHDGEFFRYIFGERTPISFSDLSFEINLLQEIQEKQFSQQASLRFLRMKLQELDNKVDLAQAVLDTDPQILYSDLLKKANTKPEEFELVVRLLAAERGINISHVLMSAHYDYIVKVRPILSSVLGNSKQLEVLVEEVNPAALALIMMADGKKSMNQLLRNISPNLKPQLNRESLWENLRKLADLGVLELIPRDDIKTKLSQW